MKDLKIETYEACMKLQRILARQQFHGFHGHRGFADTSRGQGRVLAILKMKENISQKELSYLLDMSKQSLAELLAKLEKKGFINREPSSEDRRVSNISLTEKGKEAAEFKDESEDKMNFLDCLNEEELEIFLDYLNRIIEYYQSQFMNDEDFVQRKKVFEKFMKEHEKRENGRDFRFRGFKNEEEE